MKRVKHVKEKEDLKIICATNFLVTQHFNKCLMFAGLNICGIIYLQQICPFIWCTLGVI